MKASVLALLLLLVTATCFAQSDCGAPTLKLLGNDGKALGATVTKDNLINISNVLQSAPDCPAGTSYEIVRGMAYIVRNNELKAKIRIEGDYLLLSSWIQTLEPGDRVTFKLTHLYAVNARGEKKPYTKPVTSYITIK